MVARSETEEYSSVPTTEMSEVRNNNLLFCCTLSLNLNLLSLYKLEKCPLTFPLIVCNLFPRKQQLNEMCFLHRRIPVKTGGDGDNVERNFLSHFLSCLENELNIPGNVFLTSQTFLSFELILQRPGLQKMSSRDSELNFSPFEINLESCFRLRVGRRGRRRWS